MLANAAEVLRVLGGGLRSVAPVIGILLVFQFVVLRQPLENWREVAVGLALTVVGLVVFLKGLEVGLTPLGEAASGALARRGSLPLVAAFGVALGYGATLAEPALRILAERVEDLTGGALGATLFTQTVAVGVALGMAVGASRSSPNGSRTAAGRPSSSVGRSRPKPSDEPRVDGDGRLGPLHGRPAPRAARREPTSIEPHEGAHDGAGVPKGPGLFRACRMAPRDNSPSNANPARSK